MASRSDDPTGPLRGPKTITEVFINKKNINPIFESLDRDLFRDHGLCAGHDLRKMR